MPGPRITIVVGLPGSGKTTTSKQIASEGGLVGRSDKDDDFLRGDLGAGFGLEGVIDRLKAGRWCVVNDIDLCREEKRAEVEHRIKAEIPGVEIDWVYLENDPLQCVINVVLDWVRGKRLDPLARLGKIRFLTPRYRPTPGARRVLGELQLPPIEG